MKRKTLPYGRIIAGMMLGVTVVLLSGCLHGDDVSAAHSEHYEITLGDPGHTHAYGEASLVFKVANDAGEGIEGLSPVVSRQWEGSDEPRNSKDGDVVDNGDGTYTWDRTFTDAGFYVLVFRFEHDGITYSNSFPLEVSQAGSERIYCPDETSPEYVYQIRWEASPGHIHAGGEITFTYELKRSFNATVNTEQPWMNTFDHLAPADLVPEGSLPQIFIGSAAGETPITVTYKGTGIYQGTMQFSEDIHEETPYWHHVVFTDSCGAVNESGETEHDYEFHVVPGH